MKLLRLLVAACALAVLVTVVTAVALAAPAALSPTRTAAAAEYCAPGVKEQRQQAVAALNRAVQNNARALKRLRTTQAKVKARYVKLLAKRRMAKPKRAKLVKTFVRRQKIVYTASTRQLNRLRANLRAAQAALGRCD